MELINTNCENSFDPTPKLKSSPVPILFISFNKDEDKCSYCGNKYSETLQYNQKYCKNCLFWYIKYITDDNAYLDVHIVTNNTKCIEHEATRNTDTCTSNIQEWCEHCSDISYFNQIITHNSLYLSCFDPNEKYCKLCRKFIYQENNDFDRFKLCSDCYLISSGWVESTLVKKPIPILYLPWWDSILHCIGCIIKNLSFVSDYQKWCSDCYVIYTGCRYCLTTNIIFGPANQSQCRKCKRISIININITNISSRDHSVDEILNYINFDIQTDQISDCMNNVDFYHPSSLQNFYDLVRDKFKPILKPKMKWIPYSQIKNLTEIAKGGFGIIYKATLDKPVALKKFFNSQNMSKCFLKELKALYQCYSPCIIKYIGITQDPKTKEFMLIMDYVDGGDLHNYLQKNFANITWEKKLHTLWIVSMGLETIHNKNYIHRDFHSGNVLVELFGYSRYLIGDLGLSQPANNTSNNEIYGVIPYIAPEIFKGVAFSKESDIYSMGMIMWELTTGCKPFANVEHDTELICEIIDGKRPEITNDTPELFANLMKRCWDSDPLKRPSINEIRTTTYTWYNTITYYFTWYDNSYKYYEEIFEQAENKRIELIQSKKLGPEFSEKPHLKAIFTSRALSSLIPKSSSISPSSITSSNMRQRYITKEYDLDINNIDIQRSASLNINSVQNSLNTRHSAVYTISTVNSSRKRNIEELKEIEVQNNGKCIKSDDSFNSKSKD